MKKTNKSKKETICPIGFLQDTKSPSIFCNTKENPHEIFAISSKNSSFMHFSKTREKFDIKHGSIFKKITLAEVDNILSSKVGKKEILTFTHGNGKQRKLCLAVKKAGKWVVLGDVPTIKEKGGIVSDLIHKDNCVLYYGESDIRVAASPDFKKWLKVKEPVLKPRPGFFDKIALRFIASKVTKKGVLVFYDATFVDGSKIKIQVGAALFSSESPSKLIWRSDTPVFDEEIPFEKGFICKGALFSHDSINVYWFSPERGLLVSSILLPLDEKNKEKKSPKLLKRNIENPVIKPIKENWWQAEGVFNPTALDMDGKVHLLFRAIGKDGISRVGYAASEDGLTIDEISPEPVFYLRYPSLGENSENKKYDMVMYPSGGSWGGCEDPRMVEIDDTIYMTFNSFDGWDNMRVGITCISKEDFLNKKWNWCKPNLISPGRAKNWVIFPEKINNKFAILHNIHSRNHDEVLVEYFDSLDDLDASKMTFDSPDPHKLPSKKVAWHARMRSAGPPPIKTDSGWLILYHANDNREPWRYKMGAMLLDLNDPTKVIARSTTPILTPDMWYENDSKPGIVYACGAVTRNDTLYVYYGGGDKHVCVATVPLKSFINSLKKDTEKPPFSVKVIIS